VVNPLRPRAWLVLSVILAAVAYVVAAFCLAPLTWDGAGYVFNSIQRGRPAIPNGRYSDYPFLAVISVCSLLINDARWLTSIYGLVLAVLPLGSLVLSFCFLSGPRLRSLRIWPVFGILLSVLPGQIFLVAEAVPLVQVAWAVWAIAAGEISGPSLVWLAALNIFLFFLHPTAALVYAVTAGLFLARAWIGTGQPAGTSENERQRAATSGNETECEEREGVEMPRAIERMRRPLDRQHRDLISVLARCRSISALPHADQWLGLAFLALAAIRLWYALATANSYERGEETFAQNYLTFCDALPSIRMLPFVYFLGLTVLGGMTGWIPSRLTIWLAGVSLGLLVLDAMAWATDPHVWTSAFSFRRFVLIGTLPLLAMGTFHWWYENVASTHDPKRPSSESGLGFIASASAAAFLFVFVTQSFSWRQELTRFEADLSRCNKPVATTADLPWISRSPIKHWASTQLSCVVQGKKVKTLFALDAKDVQGDKILLFPGIWFRKRNRWFEFDR
jgi:hypothetical protein